MISKRSTKQLPKMILLASLFILSFSGAECNKQVPVPIIIPSDMNIEDAPGRPGYYIVSGAFLQQTFDQQRTLVEELEKCKVKCLYQ